jgi:serine/threonine protein kinase
LKTLPPEIGNLNQLTNFKLYGCKSLKTLPPEIGNLNQLTELKIYWCESLTTLPPEIGNLKKLTELDLAGCVLLTTLPPEIGNLEELTELNLSDCTSLMTLPHNIGSLYELKTLVLFGTENLVPELPSIFECKKRSSFLNGFLLLRAVNSEAIDEIKKKKSILFLAVEHPEFARGIAMVWRNEPSLFDLKDRSGRTVWDLACTECRRELLFYRRYKLDRGEPRYKSTTCKVIFATDYEVATDEGKTVKRVALKFFYKAEHFDAEKNARIDENNNSRFDNQYVIGHLDFHDGKKCEVFAEAAKKRDLPEFCLVLELGDRNLYEAIGAEDLRSDQNQVRSILHNLAESLSHLHEKGFVHGDFKPRNAVRGDSEPRNAICGDSDPTVLGVKSERWKLIDFDAAVPFDEPMGLKFTTAYVPPEMVEIRNGIPVLLARGNERIKEAEVLKAAASFDVWSFGIVMFRLVTGGLPLSFGDVDDQDNLDDLGLLAEWSYMERDIALRKVGDPLAKTLLRTLLDRDPLERPSMKAVCKDYFFRPSDYVDKLKADLREAQALGNTRLVAVLTKKIDEIGADVKEVREDVKEGFRKQDRVIGMLLQEVQNIAVTLSNFQRVTVTMLKSILINEFAPKYVFMRPMAEEKDFTANAIDCFKPQTWISKKVKVYFVCPVTLKCSDEYYELTMPRDWVKKYGPALGISLTVLQVACGVGRLTGFPIPNINDIPMRSWGLWWSSWKRR